MTTYKPYNPETIQMELDALEAQKEAQRRADYWKGAASASAYLLPAAIAVTPTVGMLSVMKKEPTPVAGFGFILVATVTAVIGWTVSCAVIEKVMK
jgi:hypothetical protein